MVVVFSRERGEEWFERGNGGGGGGAERTSTNERRDGIAA
jgi:hypothetical protein